MSYNMLWLDRLVERMCRYLDDRYPGGHGWTYAKMARGSYFFRRHWMEQFHLGEAQRPAFHFFVDNKAGQHTIDCACRLERANAKKVKVVIPEKVNRLFPPEDVADIGYIPIDFPNGFQVNKYDQQLDEAIWTGIVQQFLNEAVVQSFLSLNIQ